jgi:hypothetical protein
LQQKLRKKLLRDNENFHYLTQPTMKRQYGTYLPTETIGDFEAMCGDAMEPTRYLAAWVTELARVKPEYALKVLGLIPDEWKKRRPGRPPSTATRTDTTTLHAEATRQDVA